MSTITINGQVVDLTELVGSLDVDELTRLQSAAESTISKREVEILTLYLDDLKPELKPAETTARVGAFRSTEFRHNGKLLKVTVNITDVQATKAREPQFPKKSRAKKDAPAQDAPDAQDTPADTESE